MIPVSLRGITLGDLFVECHPRAMITIELTSTEYTRQLERLADRWHHCHLDSEGGWWLEWRGDSTKD